MARTLITGPGRSGTSVVASMVEALGLRLPGPLIGPHPVYNPYGHYEHSLVHALTREGWRGTLPAGSLRTRLAKLLRDEDAKGPYAIKDPGLVLVWDDIAAVCQPCRLVFCLRSLPAVARSRGNGHSAIDEDQAIDYAVETELATLRTIQAAGEAGLPFLLLGYEDLLAGPRAEAERLASFLGIDDAEAIERAAAKVDPAASLCSPGRPADEQRQRLETRERLAAELQRSGQGLGL